MAPLRTSALVAVLVAVQHVAALAPLSRLPALPRAVSPRGGGLGRRGLPRSAEAEDGAAATATSTAPAPLEDAVAKAAPQAVEAEQPKPFGYTPPQQPGKPAAYSDRTVLLEEARNPWRLPRQLIYVLCIGGGGISAYFTGIGLLARSMGVTTASVANQETTEIVMNLAIDVTAFVFGVVSWINESKSREKALARISADEEGESMRIKNEDDMKPLTRLIEGKGKGAGLFDDDKGC
mmetsp:Transcript_14152/g.32900  ORF Transcript_14152/g.32900 Transcript_14152/m.32900 type:complete len:236 (+) Transcript_14152:31-738(+)